MLVTIQQRDRLEQGLGKEEMKHFTGSKLTTEDLQGVAHVLNVNFQVATLSVMTGARKDTMKQYVS